MANFCNFIGENQIVINKNKPLDQKGLTDANASNRSTKLQNKIDTHPSILDRLMDFAASVPDFRRNDKGNIRHRLADIIMLMIFGRAFSYVARADIIEFGKHNLNKLHRLGMLKNGVPSEPTLCRIEKGLQFLTKKYTTANDCIKLHRPVQSKDDNLIPT